MTRPRRWQVKPLDQIHQRSICRGDFSEPQNTLMRNVIVSKGGVVKWIDFEHLWIDNNGTDIEDECLIALELWVPDGDVWRKMYFGPC